MSERTGITELVRARRAGELTRDAYWLAMQARHRELREYQELVHASGLDALEVGPTGLLVRLDGGVRIGLNPDDFRSPPTVLLNDGEYEATEWAIVRALGVAARTVLDVGANIGWYSIRLAAARGDRPGIHAFEPVPTTYDILRDNVRVNNFQGRVEPHPYGLSDRDDVVTFYLPERTGSVAASERPLFEEEEQVVAECRIRRLDDVVRESAFEDIDFVKCDIEGGEFGFLKGAQGMLETSRPTILLEMLRKWAKVYGYHPNDIIGWMKSLDYACAGVSERSVVRVAAVTDETIETNFLFVPTDRLEGVAAMLAPGMDRVALD